MTDKLNQSKKWLDKNRVSYTVSADMLIYVDDNIVIENNDNLELHELAEVSGYVDVQQGATFTAPALAKSGYVDVQQGATITAPALAKSGSVYVRQGATFTAPALAKSGYVYVRQGATFTAPALAEVSGYVDVQQGATFTAPALAKSGYVYVRQGATFTAPALAKSGSVYVRQGATFTAPALAKSGSVYVQQGATFTAPALAEVSGYVDVRQGATFTAPELVTIGHVAYETEIFGFKIHVYDDMGCVILSEKKRGDITIRNCKKAKFKDSKLVGEKYYVVSKGEHNAHGETLESAMSDLMFKTADRDISKYRNMPMTTDKTPQEWSVIYRIVTGACQYGTQKFIEDQGELKSSYTLSEILKITNGAYGSDRFKDVCKGGR